LASSQNVKNSFTATITSILQVPCKVLFLLIFARDTVFDTELKNFYTYFLIAFEIISKMID
ncbi:hypothetical protein, partial [Streptococcus mutans]|uniref:hypothetical protein n=1 Tax=Streptococcus mutans TaxID=1309 RepID=UPI000516C870